MSRQALPIFMATAARSDLSPRKSGSISMTGKDVEVMSEKLQLPADYSPRRPALHINCLRLEQVSTCSGLSEAWQKSAIGRYSG